MTAALRRAYRLPADAAAFCSWFTAQLASTHRASAARRSEAIVPALARARATWSLFIVDDVHDPAASRRCTAAGSRCCSLAIVFVVAAVAVGSHGRPVRATAAASLLAG